MVGLGGLTSASHIIQMGHITQTKGILNCLNSGHILACENLVNVTNDGLNVRRAVSRHVQPNGLEILPEIAEWLMSI